MYLIGASGHARVIIDIFKLRGQPVAGIFDDDPQKEELDGIPVLGNSSMYDKNTYGDLIIAIGDQKVRKELAGKVDGKFAVAVHPGAMIADSVQIDIGTVVMAGAVINPGTRIGKHVIINSSASVDHDCVIEDFVHIAPNATLCGGITIGEEVLVGSGAVIIPNITVGRGAVIGAGTVVTTDVPENAVVVGNPGKIIRYND